MKNKNFSAMDMQKKDMVAMLNKMAAYHLYSNHGVASGNAEHYEGLKGGPQQMAMDDDARARWQQGLAENVNCLIYLVHKCLEEITSLEETVSNLRNDVTKEQKMAKQLKKRLKKARNDIADLSSAASKQDRRVKKLATDVEDTQAVTSYMGFLAGICIPNTPVARLRKMLERKHQVSFNKGNFDFFGREGK